MNLYKWEGKGKYIGATIIVVSDCLVSASMLIQKELTNKGLEHSWYDNPTIEAININQAKVVYVNDGDY